MSKKIYCRLCNSKLIDQPAFTLSNLPLGVQYFPDEYNLVKDRSVELEIFRCNKCGFVQAFGNQVVYENENSAATSLSPAMSRHKMQQATDFINKYDLKNKNIFEAGCGDGHFLKMLSEAGAGLVVGVEPSIKSKETSTYKSDVIIYSDYITKSNILTEAPFDGFATFHVMEHLPDIHDFIAGLSINLKVGGVGLVEVPSSEQIEEELRFYDYINDHLNYFTLRTLRLAFEMNNFDVIDSFRDWKGEHDVIYVRKREDFNFKKLEKAKNTVVRNVKKALNDYDDNSVAIWGASQHALTLLSQFRSDKIRFVIDSAKYKQKLFTPVSHLPIVDPFELTNDIDLVIIIAPRYADEIVEILTKNRNYKGKIGVLENEKIIIK